jgi:hypothetical protein
MLILCDFETASRRVSLKANRSERNMIAKEDGAKIHVSTGVGLGLR